MIQYANLMRREKVSAGTNCDMSRVHRQSCGAKPQALVEGAVLASTQLWG
jgi:hypothetical protein